MISDIRKIQSASKEELMTIEKELNAPYDLILYIHENDKLPVINFAADCLNKANLLFL